MLPLQNLVSNNSNLDVENTFFFFYLFDWRLEAQRGLWCPSAPLFPAESRRVVVSLWSGLITPTPIPPKWADPCSGCHPAPHIPVLGTKQRWHWADKFARVCCCPWARAGRCTKAGCWRSRGGSDVCAQAATTFSFSVATFDSRPVAQIFGWTSLAAACDDATVRIKM